MLFYSPTPSGIHRGIIIIVLVMTAFNATAATKNGFALDNALVPQEQILHGGPGRDGIPSLDYPKVIAASKASYMHAQDRVLGVAINGVKRAYPIRILNYHEIVNDIVGGQALVITYCPLCGTGMAFHAERDGKIVEFGVSGLLYNSDVLLYDRTTGSLWSQIMKRAVTGYMKGAQLEAVPLLHTTWRDWLERHPGTKVLSDKTGYRRNYRVDPYPGYGRSGRLYFPVAEENNAYPRKAMVLGLEIDGKFKAYPFSELSKIGAGEFSDEFQGRSVTVFYDDENQSARIVDADGQEIPTLIAFWFAWYAFHPDTEIYTANQGPGDSHSTQPSR